MTCYVDTQPIRQTGNSCLALTAPEPAPILKSISDALGLAADRHGDILDIWEDARRSAEESHISSPTRVLDALRAIAEVGRAYFRTTGNGQSLGPLDQAFHQRVPF